MTGPDAGTGLEAGPLSKDCVPAWLELLGAVERADRAGEHIDAEELNEALSDPKLDLEQDTLGLWEGSRLVAYAVVHTPHGALDVARFQGDAAVHPERRRRGVGSRLVAWMEERATARHAALPDLSALPGELLLDGRTKDEGLRHLAEGCGYTPCRWWFEMKHPLTGDAPPARPAPEGTRVVPFDSVYDEATRLAHNDAFRDHWNFAPFDRTDWNTWVTGAGSFRPAMSRLLVTDTGGPGGTARDGARGTPPVDEVAAYLLAEESEADTAATGRRDCHVGYLGTRRAHRGRGAAPALLTELLRAARAAGYDTASLTVDTVNPSGALGFYEGAGFVVDRESVTYARPLGTDRTS
ncbi:GNAT family N-acetyltransferase [Streptomyces sp. p1417]|uniref:GNAT family N-acetyltransferase n=1 Tax=Streptomyces typhae TaxID=2681492 RepID=A0A6L6XAD6_9ACTN|nr:GNAT family N-acetyltransferase [Streptomyces typhae]MVO90862.1 GNAT family N-acetyltransferase [Streptomyces typhae]